MHKHFKEFAFSVFASMALIANAVCGPTISTNASAGADNHGALATETLSPDEWQELRLARSEALSANPALSQKAAQLSQRLRDFQHKLDLVLAQEGLVSGPIRQTKSSSPSPPTTGK